jgi:sugar phosphate isomerase/epimerase
MKLGLWTIGMPDWTNQEFARQAARHGYQGIDLRCKRRDGKAISRPVNIAVDSTPEFIAETKAAFAAANVEIASLLIYNGSPAVNDAEAWSTFESEIALHAKLATRLGTSRIRFCAEGPPDGVTWEDYMIEIWRAVGRVLDHFPGMDAVIENHVGRANTAQLAKTAEKVGDKRIGIELSPEHAYVMQENVLELIERYTPHIHQICWADRKVVQHELGRFDKRYYHVRYESCWNGDGIVPTEAVLNALAKNGFDDYVSLKWEKSNTYGAHLPPGEEALAHFPGFIRAFGHFERAAAAAPVARGRA